MKVIHQPAPRPTAIRMYALLCGIILILGLSWPVSKIGLEYMSPLWFVAFRLLIGTATILIIVTFSRKLVIPQREDLPIILIIGLLQIAAFMLLVNCGLAQVAAGRAAILVYTTPFWVIPLAIFCFDERVSVLQWLGVLWGIIGLLILLGPWEMNWADPKLISGCGYLLIAALCWAISMLSARHLEWSKTPLELIFWQLLLATIPLLLLACWREPFAAIQWNGRLVACLLYAGVLATALGYWGVIIISKELPSSKASFSFLGVPVSGVLFSAAFLKEPITLAMIIAIGFILLGLVFVAFSRHKR